MGKKVYKRRERASTKMKEKNPATLEHTSAQVIQQPRMKKGSQRRQTKPRLSYWRPYNSFSQQKTGQGRSQDSKVHKRSQEKRVKTYYSSLKGDPAKFPTESKANHIPPKTAIKQQQSNSREMKVEDRNACSYACRTENPQPPLAEQSRFSSTREKQRSKLSAVEKRRYQTVSEYQFIYPGKSMFHCTKESVKQQLRSIYLGRGGQKSLKPTHQSTRTPRNQWEKNKTERENTKTDASCPVGSEFLRSVHPNTTPQELSSLTNKISKLVLTNEAEMAPSCASAELQDSPQLQHQPAPSKLSLPAAVLQWPSSFKERKTSKGRQHVEEEFISDVPLQGATGNMLEASPTSSTKLRPLSAKNSCGKTLNKISGEDNQTGNSSQKEDTPESTPDPSTSSKGGVSHTQSTRTMPTFHQFLSKENMNVEVPPGACSNTMQCRAEVRQREPPPVACSQPAAREEKIPGIHVHCSSGEERQAYSFVTAGSKSYESVSVDTR